MSGLVNEISGRYLLNLRLEVVGIGCVPSVALHRHKLMTKCAEECPNSLGEPECSIYFVQELLRRSVHAGNHGVGANNTVTRLGWTKTTGDGTDYFTIEMRSQSGPGVVKSQSTDSKTSC
ncbi:hypothetical protein AVEN_165911-1 [Araneus ventricosus]|uniref:Uncharacterized protein n=1 Tax=Araneus ventricosus TaxID=182803 RepID=A0A4Y2P4P9_ARAVE|nr:hypothetical protein AVEN_165911-1 [Araneus ventricosus]